MSSLEPYDLALACVVIEQYTGASDHVAETIRHAAMLASLHSYSRWELARMERIKGIEPLTFTLAT